jgi:HK97 family phage prohead protease
VTELQHKTATAAATPTTDQGLFSAIAAAYTVDRQNEQIVKGAFTNTIDWWQQSGKQIPLHWNHQSGAESVIGSVDPHSLEERDGGLFIEGQLDIEDSELAKEAWRSVKRGRVGLSFGYLVTDEHDRSDGIKELRGLDLFEVSLTGSPANRDTRILDTKSINEFKAVREHADELLAEQRPPIRIARFDV